jgi:diacylglycerol kinase (ATP)
MRTLLVHNPSAGDGRLEDTTLVRLFEAEGDTVTYRNSSEKPGLREAAEAADLVVVAGGDGDVGGTIRALYPLDRPIAIVPLGTANNIARCLGLPEEPARTAMGCRDWGERRLDLGVADGPWGRAIFVESVGAGALAELIAAGDAGDLSFDEEKRFAAEAPAPFLSASETHEWQVELDGSHLPHALLLVEILNTPMVGPNLPIGLTGPNGDGLFAVAILEPEGRDDFTAWLDGPRNPPASGLRIKRGQHVRMLWSGQPLRIDDNFPDYPNSPTTLDIRLDRERLRVMVPREKGDTA